MADQQAVSGDTDAVGTDRRDKRRRPRVLAIDCERRRKRAGLTNLIGDPSQGSAAGGARLCRSLKSLARGADVSCDTGPASARMPVSASATQTSVSTKPVGAVAAPAAALIARQSRPRRLVPGNVCR
jgi:hypothetical protein